MLLQNLPANSQNSLIILMSNSILVYSIFDNISQSTFILNQYLNHQCVLSLAFPHSKLRITKKKGAKLPLDEPSLESDERRKDG